MRKTVFLFLSMSAIIFSACFVSAYPIKNIVEMGSVVYEQYSKTEMDTGRLKSSQNQFSSYYFSSGIPLPKWAGRPIYLSLEADLLDRKDVILDGEKIINAPLFRTGIFFGSKCFIFNKHEIFIYLMSGLSGSQGSLPPDAFYFQPIVEWNYKISPNLTLGLGAQFSYNFDRWTMFMGLPFSPLITVVWQISPSTLFKINWDYANLRLGLSPHFTAILEAKYSSHFMRLENQLSYEYENIWAGGGVDVKLYKKAYLRLRIKKDLSTEERIFVNGLKEESDMRDHGYGFRIAISYMDL